MNSKTALITGAASGIGLAISKSLAAQGFKVLLTDLNIDAARAAATEIGGNATAIRLDVSSQQEIDHVAENLIAAGNTIDVLINNAGLQHVAKLEEFPTDKWKLLIEVLLVGPAMLTRALLPMMRDNNFGRIVNIGSIHGLVASPFKSAYVTAKHGLLGFAKTVALETADQDITINTICPSYVKTALVEQQISQQAKQHGISEEDVINTIMLAPMPKKHFISIDEICLTVDYLIGDATRNMTGQCIVLDGGWTAN